MFITQTQKLKIKNQNKGVAFGDSSVLSFELLVFILAS